MQYKLYQSDFYLKFVEFKKNPFSKYHAVYIRKLFCNV